MNSNKMKYAVIRHTIRRMIAQGCFNNPNGRLTGSGVALQGVLEAVRTADDETLKAMEKSAKALRKSVAEITGSNGGTIERRQPEAEQL